MGDSLMWVVWLGRLACVSPTQTNALSKHMGESPMPLDPANSTGESSVPLDPESGIN